MEYQEVALMVPYSCRPYQRVLNVRAKACLKEFVGEKLAAEISTLKSVTSLLVKTQMTDAFSNDVSQSSTRTQSIDDGDEIEDAGDKSKKSVVQYSKMNWSAVYRMTDKLPVMYLYLGIDNDLHSTPSLICLIVANATIIRRVDPI